MATSILTITLAVLLFSAAYAQDDTGLLSMTNQTCFELFSHALEDNALNENPATVLQSLTQDICLPMLDNIDNAIKPTVCVYTSIFTLAYVRKIYTDVDQLNLYTIDYCSNLKTAV